MLRVVLVGAGLIFAAVVLVAGLVFALLLVIWSVLRGRPPRLVKFPMNQGDPFAAMRRRSPLARGEVVDVEAREVHDVNARLPGDKG